MWSVNSGIKAMFSTILNYDVSPRYEVEEMLAEVEEKRTGHPEQPNKPLLRLRVEYNDEVEMLNASR